jgi:hypothetical protein
LRHLVKWLTLWFPHNTKWVTFLPAIPVFLIETPQKTAFLMVLAYGTLLALNKLAQNVIEMNGGQKDDEKI